MLMIDPKITFYKRLLTAAYTDWLACGSDLDCGLHLAKHIKASQFAAIESRCKKYAKKLRALGAEVPPVPGEPGFK